ncbi:unnamed protein product [Prorocentrum cordatum]|uniref:Uncharacterized protein n=1 Tax=Prorocentrum cordatum TaxID=2364126 RepID=A0ABN9T702_9DINO|nr:unnamed protein product [Polarella glacialis]
MGRGMMQINPMKANKSADNLSRGVGALFGFLAVVLVGLCVPYDPGEATAPGVNATNASSPGASLCSESFNSNAIAEGAFKALWNTDWSDGLAYNESASTAPGGGASGKGGGALATCGTPAAPTHPGIDQALRSVMVRGGCG